MENEKEELKKEIKRLEQRALDELKAQEKKRIKQEARKLLGLRDSTEKGAYRPKRDKNGYFLPGSTGNPGGKPVEPMKAFLRRRLLEMTDEEKAKFMKRLAPDFIVRAAEGNPHNTTDVTSNGQPIIPIIPMDLGDNKDDKE